MIRNAPRVTIVTVTPLFPKSPYGFFRRPNNREKGHNRHYCHSLKPVFAMFQGAQP